MISYDIIQHNKMTNEILMFYDRVIDSLCVILKNSDSQGILAICLVSNSEDLQKGNPARQQSKFTHYFHHFYHIAIQENTCLVE